MFRAPACVRLLPELWIMGWQVDKIPSDNNKSPMCLLVPDLIFHNANVITMDESQPSAEAVVIDGNRIHAIGDAAIDQVLNAVEAALAGESHNLYRHQIHHSSVLRSDELARYVEIDLLTSVRGYFNTCVPDEYPTWYGSDRKELAINRFALADAGVHTFAEGDFGWTSDPDEFTSSRTINPLLNVNGLVTHRQLRADCTACEPEP